MILADVRIKSRQDWDKIFGMAKSGYLHAQMYESGKELIYKMMAFGVNWKNARVLDLGCGNGRLAASLTELPITSYVGIDPIVECIDFCKESFSQYSKFTFEHIDLQNSMYNPKGQIKSDVYSFPFADKSFDIIIALSVFTHLQSLSEAKNFIKEMYRLLNLDGFSLTTWFRSPPNLVNFRNIEHTTYKESDIMSMLRGFETIYTDSGHNDQWHDQWLILGKLKNNKIILL